MPNKPTQVQQSLFFLALFTAGGCKQRCKTQAQCCSDLLTLSDDNHSALCTCFFVHYISHGLFQVSVFSPWPVFSATLPPSLCCHLFSAVNPLPPDLRAESRKVEEPGMNLIYSHLASSVLSWDYVCVSLSEPITASGLSEWLQSLMLHRVPLPPWHPFIGNRAIITFLLSPLIILKLHPTGTLTQSSPAPTLPHLWPSARLSHHLSSLLMYCCNLPSLQMTRWAVSPLRAVCLAKAGKCQCQQASRGAHAHMCKSHHSR